MENTTPSSVDHINKLKRYIILGDFFVIVCAVLLTLFLSDSQGNANGFFIAMLIVLIWQMFAYSMGRMYAGLLLESILLPILLAIVAIFSLPGCWDLCPTAIFTMGLFGSLTISIIVSLLSLVRRLREKLKK